MPGERLTRHERRRIARGLLQGSSYAAIARGLDRPTSTISREVARNGGREAYDAAMAHEATEHRSRRAGPVANAASADRTGRDLDTVRAFRESFMEMMTATGIPRMPARVLVALLTSDEDSLTVNDLVAQLRVSPASVSKAISYLETLQFVTRDRVPGQRRERYGIDGDVWFRAWSRRAGVFALWERMSKQGAIVLGANTQAGRRLDEMAEFFGLVHRDVLEVTEHWRRFFSERRTGRVGKGEDPVAVGE